MFHFIFYAHQYIQRPTVPCTEASAYAPLPQGLIYTDVLRFTLEVQIISDCVLMCDS